MKVLYIAAECKPFAKTGGVGDVAGELPLALKALGVDIEIVTPWYGQTAAADPALAALAARAHDGLVEADLDGVPVTFVKSPAYFETDYRNGDRTPPLPAPHLFRRDYSTPYVHSGNERPFADDAVRFAQFSRACLAVIERRDPDIVHVNDWVLGYLLGWMTIRALRPRKVLTIHNVGYQGNLARETIVGWPMEELADHPVVGPLFADPRPAWRSVNALRLGMELADVVNTVSPTYKRELTEAEDPSRFFEGGKGLERIAARLDAAGRLHGILNGFAYPFAPDDAQFARVLAEKGRAKSELGRRFAQPDGVLLGFVGRAVEQKFKLLAELLDGKSVLEHILDLPGVNVAVVATGQPEYELFLRRFAGRPNFDATIAFDRERARQISLGSDVFLMPSLFEPCGIAQMESLSCATPPLVRWTGGLVDTVAPHTDPGAGTGFGFDGATRREVLAGLVAAAREAVRLRREEPARFRVLQRRGFAARFLWSTAAQAYVQRLYEPVLASR